MTSNPADWLIEKPSFSKISKKNFVNSQNFWNWQQNAKKWFVSFFPTLTRSAKHCRLSSAIVCIFFPAGQFIVSVQQIGSLGISPMCIPKICGILHQQTQLSTVCRVLHAIKEQPLTHQARVLQSLTIYRHQPGEGPVFAK